MQFNDFDVNTCIKLIQKQTKSALALW